MTKATSPATNPHSAANKALRDRVMLLLQPWPLRARAMFGGYGLYLDGVFFGVVSNGRLYFRTDDDTRAGYLERGMQPLQPKHRPRGPKTVDRNFEVPEAVLEDATMLQAWAITSASTAKRTAWPGGRVPRARSTPAE